MCVWFLTRRWRQRVKPRLKMGCCSLTRETSSWCSVMTLRRLVCARFLLSLPARGDFFHRSLMEVILIKFLLWAVSHIQPLSSTSYAAQRHSGIFPLRLQLCDSISGTWLPGFKSVLKHGFTPSAHRDAAVTLDVNKIAQQWWENPTLAPLLLSL